MYKYRAVIIDDEHSGREVLSRLLTAYIPEIDLAGKAAGLQQGRLLIEQHSPAIVFLDIHLNDESGFDLLQMENAIPFALIFVTGFENYAINAIRYKAVDYLLKPVHIEELRMAVARAIERYEEIKTLRNNAAAPKTFDKLAIHFNNQVVLIDPGSLLYARSDRRYSHLFLKDGRMFTAPRSINDLLTYWNACNYFCRINRHTLINLHYIASYSKTWPCTITLQNQQSFQISRRKKAEVLQLLDKFRPV